MRTTIYLLIFLNSMMIESCEKRNDDLRIKNLSYDGCKVQLKSSSSTETIHLKIVNDQLLVEHSNIYFNCEPGKITVNCDINNNQIAIYEDEEKNEADCICPYDLDFTIDDVKTGETTITFFLMGQERLIYNLNLNNSLDTLININ